MELPLSGNLNIKNLINNRMRVRYSLYQTISAIVWT